MIRHGEKPPKEADGKDADGLSAQGITRAQGLCQVFGKSSQYNINYILAEHPKSGSFLLHFPPPEHYLEEYISFSVARSDKTR
jgi:hypothetical protein